MADSETQQVTSQTPATKPKNPKRVAAGKAIAEKTRQAREAQKKALAEAQVIIANNQLKPPPVSGAPSAPPVSDAVEPSKITTTQWLSVISIIVSLVGVYYKREEIKSVFTKKHESNRRHLLCCEHPHHRLLMPLQKGWESERWIRLLLFFYNNG